MWYYAIHRSVLAFQIHAKFHLFEKGFVFGGWWDIVGIGPIIGPISSGTRDNETASLSQWDCSDQLSHDRLDETSKNNMELSALIMAKHLVKSHHWELEYLGPLSTKVVSEIPIFEPRALEYM